MTSTGRALTKEAVLEAMDAGVPYAVSEFDDRFDCSRWTILRRLNELNEDGKLEKKKHAKRRTSYWIPAEKGEE